MPRSVPSLVLALALLAGCSAEPESGVEPGADTRWAYALASELMSPYCPGRTLAECPSPQAGELRAWISVQAAAGRSRDDVLDELYERFGDQIRGAPRAEGIGLTAYALPIGAFLAGGVVVAFALRRLTGRGGPPDDPPAPGGAAPSERDEELERIVDEELRG